MHIESRSGLRILVVDDHEDSVRALVRLLSMNGFPARGATGSAIAMAMLQAEPFDLMLCDVGMPDMDGYSLLAAARAIRPIKAFAVTGYGYASDISRITAEGFDDYFLKPYDLAKLLDAADRVTVELAGKRAVPASSLSTSTGLASGGATSSAHAPRPESPGR